MITEIAVVESVEQLEKNIYLLKVKSPQIAEECLPGQFCNIKVSEGFSPLLRRPFSICDCEDDYLWFMFEIVGEGTEILAKKEKGDELDILGPLGNGFDYEGDFDTAVLVGGGLGIAPLPFLTSVIPDEKDVVTFIGGRTSEHLTDFRLENIYVATDDGSLGLKGTVLDLMEKNKKLLDGKKLKIFSCGPTPMLKALKEYAESNNYDCQLSTECAMACGFGICQGCAVEDSENKEKYKLVCIDGPVFDAREIEL